MSSFFSYGVLAASWATVIVSKAVVYADAQMTSKVGFLKKDKKIRIGDKSINKNRLYPFIYQKRVLYIKRSDIQTSDELLALSSAMDRALKKTVNIQPYQKLSLGLGLSHSDISSSKSYDSVNEKTMNFFSLTLAGYHMRPSKKDGFKISFDYSSASLEEETLSLLNIDLYYLKRLISYKRIKLYANAALLVTPLFTYRYGDDFTQNGSGFGASLGAESSYMLTRNLNLDLSFDYRYQSLSVDLPSGINPSNYKPTIISPRLGLAVSYSY
jgi:hypothetical protein